jgi:hypothetical protein
VTAVLDAGALIAVDKRDRVVGAMLRVLQRDGVQVVTSAAVVAQVWHDPRRQVNLARVLTGVDVAALDDVAAKRSVNSCAPTARAILLTLKALLRT